MATTTTKKTSTSTAKKATTKTTAKAATVKEPEVVEEVVKVEEPVVKKEPRQYNQTDLILCRSVTAGWLGLSGKSGQYYVFQNVGDLAEIEYQDLFALKSSRSQYLFDPLFVIEDEELLESPRWKDLKQFYDEKLYTMEDVDEVLNLPPDQFRKIIEQLPKGLAKTIQVEAAKRIEDGSFDSLKKISAMDEVFGTDFRSILAD